MNHYDVTIDFRGETHTETFVATSPGKARARCWHSLAGAGFDDLTFKEFLKCVRRVRQCHQPSSDGYDYIKRAYDKDFKVGDRVRLNEGEGSSRGLEGVVVYPGRSTAHVHVLIDGRDHAVTVHPFGVDVITSVKSDTKGTEE